MSSPVPPKVESKLAAKAARTRARLVETTLKLLTQHDFHRLSLDAIAGEAGVTKGAIYGHFGSKDALLMAALATRREGGAETMAWPKRRKGTVRQRLRRLGEMVLVQQENPGRAAVAAAEFTLYALTHEALKAQVGEVLTQTRGGMETNIRALFDPEELPMPVESFAMLVGAVIPAVLFGRAFEGERFDREKVLALFEGLAGSAR